MNDSAQLVRGFHHPGIVVPDLDSAIAFYVEFIGCELIRRASWDAEDEGFNQVIGLRGSAARFCLLRCSNSYLELFEYSSPEVLEQPGEYQANQLGIRHIAFVVEDVAAALARCVELGGSKINDPVTMPGRATAVYCRDPFGNLLELVKPRGNFPDLMTT